MKNNVLYLSITLILISFSIAGCNEKSKGGGGVIVAPIKTPSKVNLFIENSGSMKAYVANSSSEYIKVLSEITEHPKLVANKVKKEFFMTSGISTPIPVGNLRSSLKPENFNQGRSNLNELFKIAIDSAKNNCISVLVSDGIYDMCPDNNPLGTLNILGNELRSLYIQNLNNNNFQTIVVKLTSEYNGRYYPGNCKPAFNIDQKRPYYMWIFGKSDILKEYFSDDYLQSLDGFQEFARYFKVDKQGDNYMPVAHKLIGTYRPDRSNNKILTKVRSRQGVFQYSIAVDYSSLPLPEDYLKNENNYKVDDNLNIVSIEDANETVKNVFSNATHVIVINKVGNPLGTHSVVLLNNSYDWIEDTDMEDDGVEIIMGNSTQTFGFKELNKGIVEAYEHYNDTDLYEFKITLRN